MRFVRDCSVKPAEASGQVRIRFVGVAAMLIGGLLALNNWFGPKACVAAISAGESPTL
jgi:hypothetical protein